VEAAGFAGHALRDDLGVLVDEDAHLVSFLTTPAKAGIQLGRPR
jgi:hypothetical protein